MLLLYIYVYIFNIMYANIWSWWEVSSRFWIRWNFIWLKMERKTVTMIIFHSNAIPFGSKSKEKLSVCSDSIYFDRINIYIYSHLRKHTCAYADTVEKFWATLEKQQRSDVQLSERLASRGIMANKGLPETARTL